MSDSQLFNFKTDNFELAYRVADARPGEIVDFCGELPSGFFSTQKIVTVPHGMSAYAEVDRLATEFKGADVIVSSGQKSGTHIIATYGRTKAENHFS